MAATSAQTARGALAGAIAAGIWVAQQPLDKAVFGVQYDDAELLGKAVTRGPAWLPIGTAMHVANGALFGAAYANVAQRMPLPSWARGPFAAMVENVATWPLTIVAERLHPARKELPPLSNNPRAFAQATWRHLLFGFVLGELERRLNPPEEAGVPPYEHVVISTNGHGNLEHAAMGGGGLGVRSHVRMPVARSAGMLDLHRVCDERDARYDGAFVVAVRTTRIYCRPSCAGRPLPRNRSFLPSPEVARREGYRPCKRCKPDTAARLDLDFFADRAVAGVEEIVDGAYRRTLRDGSILTSLDDSALARRLRDEDADLLAVNEVLSADPVLAPLVAEAPWRRVPGHVDGFELAVRAILGQQVSVAAARTNAARLVARYGEPLASPSGSLTHMWPAPAALRDADIPGPRSRANAIRALAAADLDLSYGADPAALLELPGVGPWTASYVAMRALGDRDAFMPTDLGVRRGFEALGLPGDPRSAERHAEHWRPFRSYALQHLWAVAA